MHYYKKNILRAAATAGTVIALFSMAMFFANAQAMPGAASSALQGSGTGRNSFTANSAANIASRADQEITQRIGALGAVINRLSQMQKISAAEKNSLSSAIQSQISDLNGLKMKIGNDAGASSSLRTDLQSITKSYRIYALVVPQAVIAAAADRVLIIASATTAFSEILQTRISGAAAAGHDISALQAPLSDMNAKAADAATQAQAAINEITALVPDNSSATQMQSNIAALKDARSKIGTARQDLIAARKDAGVIVKALVAMDRPLPAASTTSSGTAQ